MAAKTEKVFNSFVKGLITEASPLTFPENASLDEENFVLNRDGSRARRLGIDYEDLYAKTPSGYADLQIQTGRQSFHKWESPGGDTSISIGVVRITNKLWFMDMLTSNPSGNLLNNGDSISITGLSNSRIETAVISNKFILVSEDLDKPVVLTYDKATGVIAQEEIDITIRDIYGVHDGLEVYERPPYSAPSSNLTSWVANKEVSLRTGDEFYVSSTDSVYQITDFYYSTRQVQTGGGIYFTYSTQNYTRFGPNAPTSTSGTEFNGNYTIKFVRYGSGSGISPAHKYNLRNQGWSTGIQVVGGGDAIDETGKDVGVYPSNADQWTLGKNSNPSSGDYEKYDPNILKKNSTSRYQAAKGSIIIDAFNRGSSRQTESNVSSGLPADQEQGNITTITSYAQRLFYSGITSTVLNGDERSPNYSGYVFFTRTIQSNRDLGRCYQEADPADPSINDLVDSDGGSIQIPDATRIIKIVASQASILVFAENGVWEIYGDTGGFIATSFQLSKISTNGVFNADSVVSVNGNFIYWSKAGIYMLTPDGASGRFKAQSLSLTTIQTLYLGIPDIGKNNCKGFYDEKENRVRWLYNDSDNYSFSNYINKYNKELVLDLTLEAFYVNKISDLASESPYVCDYVEIPGYSVSTSDTLVETTLDGGVQVTSLDDVVVTQDTLVNRSSLFSFLTIVGTQFTISKYNNDNFVDWQTEDGTGADYTSYLVTGYELMNDIMREKQAPYIFFYFKKTEDGYTEDGEGNLTPTGQSSCKVQAQWNWANHVNSGKWGREFQAYRILRFYMPTSVNDNFDNGDDVVVTKNKLRGSGKCLSLKISSEEGKDMRLLGWGFPATATNVA